MANDNLMFDILDDQAGADLLQEFYKSDADKAKDKETQEQSQNNNQEDKDLNKDKEDKQPEFKITDDVLTDLLKQQTEDKDVDKDKDNNQDKSKSSSSKVDNNIFEVLYHDFVDKNLINEVDDFDGSEESFLKAYQESIFKKAEELQNQQLEDIFTANPKNMEVGREFLSFLSKGGDPEDFISISSQKEYTEQDLDKESVQEKVVREYLKLSGIPDDKIDAKITKYKALESLEEEAKDVFDVLKKNKENQKKQLEETTVRKREDLQKRVESFNNDIIKVLDDNTELFGFHLGKDTKLKRELQDYMFKPTVKTDSGQLIPAFAAARQKVASDPKWVLLQALSLKNDLDFSKVIENVQTKVTKSLKEKLEGADEIRKNKGEGKDLNEGNNSNRSTSGSNLETLLSNTLRR